MKRLGSDLAKVAVASAMSTKLVLPSERNEPPTDAAAFTYYLYGPEKIGKTSFTAEFPDTLHFFYEPSGKDYRIFTVTPETWEETTGYIDLLYQEYKAGKSRYKNVSIDIVDLCFKQCMEYHSKKHGWGGYPPNDFGKSWGLVADAFRNEVYKLSRFMGVFFISHAKEKDIVKADDTTYHVIRPTIMKTGHDVLAKFCDVTAYFHMDKENNRKLRILPDMHVEAGNRLENHFRYTDGSPMEVIDMGKTKGDAYKNFMAAFDNKINPPTATEKPTAAFKLRKG